MNRPRFHPPIETDEHMRPSGRRILKTALLLALFIAIGLLCMAVLTSASPTHAQTCPTTSVEAFTPVVPIGTPPAGATNPRQARIDPIGQVALYDYSGGGFSYVAWLSNIRQYAYVVIGDATVGPPGGNGTVLRLDSACRITLLVQPAGAATVANRADLNGDGKVDQVDFSIFAAYFGQRGAGVPGDLNGDGVVDVADLGLFAAAFGR